MKILPIKMNSARGYINATSYTACKMCITSSVVLSIAINCVRQPKCQQYLLSFGSVGDLDLAGVGVVDGV